MSATVTIEIPADTAHIALIRAAGTALAARLEFTFDRITDLHIAIDEVCSRLLAVTEAPTTLAVSFEVQEGRLAIRATANGTRRPDRDPFTEWSRVILESIAEDVSASESDGLTTFSLMLSRTGR